MIRSPLCSHKGYGFGNGGAGWQSKIRQGRDYTNSQFQELSCPDDIGRMIKSYNIQYSPLLLGSDKTFRLKSMARFTTTREAWKADKKFKIVLDRTDYGHAVGEVQLELEVGTNENDEKNKRFLAAERQGGMTTQMDRQIETFMQEYSWVFQAVEKLSAYFAFKKEGSGLVFRG